MPEKWLEVKEHTSPDYAPLADFGSWRVALLNASPAYTQDAIRSLQRHRETDEVFVLLNGECTLLLAGGGDAPGKWQIEAMAPGKGYVVKRGAWHSHTLSADASVLVVENRDTSPANSPSIALTQPQLDQLHALLNRKEDER